MEREYIDNHLFEDSMMVLSKIYNRIYKANLQSNQYQTVKYYESEQDFLDSHSGILSDMFGEAVEDGKIHEEDVHMYMDFTDISELQKRFRKSGNGAHLRYRRKEKDEYRWSLMEIMPSAEYSDEKQEVMIYLQDINDAYIEELEEHRELEHYCKFDALTGLSNFYAYKTLCKKYTNEGRENVGVIFADLNGLKIVNDTQGHERGNEYIRSFSTLLQGYFAGRACFRISGDEFLVILDEITENEMEIRAERFHAVLQDMNVPIASMGWSWSAIPDKIESITKEAESRMYDDKHIFYEKHPEYKRGVAEQNFQKEVNSIIQTLSESYLVLYVIDLEKDTYREFKHELDFLGASKIIEGKYSEYNSNYAKNHVAEPYQVLRERIGNIDNLKIMLKTEENISCDYMMESGQWRQTIFRRMDMKGSVPSKVMVYSLTIDHARAARLSRNRKIKDEHHIVASLCAEYSIICQVDIDTSVMSIYRIANKLKDIVPYIEGQKYQHVQEWFVDKYIPDNNKEKFTHDTALLNIMEQLLEEDPVELYCKLNFSMHQRTDTFYAKFSFFSPAKGSGKLIFAARDITDVILQFMS